MANFEFAGDLKDVDVSQLDYISSVLEKRGFIGDKILLEPVGIAGDNYIANVKRIIVQRDGEAFKMVAKFAPSSEALRKAINTEIIFRNEHIMYTELLPKFRALQAAAKVPETERLRFAECYGSFTENPYELILLEDLKVSGFEMFDRFKSLPNDAVRLLLKTFAIFHSLSYVLKYQEPETYKTYQHKIINIWQLWNGSSDIIRYMNNIEKDIKLLLDEDDEDRKKYVNGIGDNFIADLAQLTEFDSKSKYSVIMQGDAWTNNIMFVLQDGEVDECCLIDYQIVREGNPVGDLQYMIFSCTDYEARSAHYHDWIDHYYLELEKALANYGLEAKFVYPRDQLDADLIRHGRTTLGHAAILATTLIRDSEACGKMKEAMETMNDGSHNNDAIIDGIKVSLLDNESKKRYKKRIEGIIDSLVEYGYIKPIILSHN